MMSDNLPDNLALQESSCKTRSFAFHYTKASSMKQAALRDILKKGSKSV
jgi:hypothetical protein